MTKRKILRSYLTILAVVLAVSIFLLNFRINHIQEQKMKEELSSSQKQLHTYFDNIFKLSVSNYYDATIDSVENILNKSSLTNCFDYFRDYRFRGGGYVYFTDKEGLILSHPDPLRIKTRSVVAPWIKEQGEKNGHTQYMYRGTDKILQKKYFPELGINIIITSPIRDFFDLNAYENVYKYTPQFSKEQNLFFDVLLSNPDTREPPESILNYLTDNQGRTIEILTHFEDDLVFGLDNNKEKIVGSLSYYEFFDWYVVVYGDEKALLERQNILNVSNSSYLLHLIMIFLSFTVIFLKWVSELQMREKNKEIIDTQKELLYILGETVESRSHETSSHVKRVAHLSDFIAKTYGMSQKERQLLIISAPLHDIGKIGIEDGILDKKAPLSEEEFEKIKTHTTIGYNILKGSEKPILKACSIIAHEHHECWDGSGYPEGKKGEEINIYARIVKVADVIDALSFKRVYKDAWPADKVFEYIEEQRGKMFDPILSQIVSDHKKNILMIINELEMEELDWKI